MAYTAVADVVIPTLTLPYVIEHTAELSTLFKSGIVIYDDSRIPEWLAGGGKTFTEPFWNTISGDPTAIQSGTDLTPAKVTASSLVFRRQLFGQGFSHEELAGALAVSKPADALGYQLVNYWDLFLQKDLTYIIRGIIADNVANDSSDLVNDVAGETGLTATDAQLIDWDKIIDTMGLFGDSLTKFNGGAIAIHSTVYLRLIKLNLIDTITKSEQDLGFGVLGGGNNITVIVNDNLPAIAAATNGYKYWTVLIEKGAFLFGEGGYAEIGAGKIVALETDRDASAGQDELYTRRQFILHAKGYDWDEGSVANENPTLNELLEAANWDRAKALKNTGFAVLITNG